MLSQPLLASATDSDLAYLTSAEGDLRQDLDLYVVSESILNAALGTQLLFLPAIVTDTSLANFREFLARESLRHHQATDPTD
jgi:hypothetical protein